MECKFRAWDHINNVMLFADIYEMQETSYEWTAWEYPKDSPKNVGTPFDIDQFIHLTDTDGDDIYAGDILQSQIDKVLLNWVVVDNGYCFAIKNIGLIPLSNTESHPIIDPLMFIDRKIIGNVYQNPELLQVKGENK